jgi:hypothetical protein
MTGYEIKISRSDFVGDDKWYEYLPTCNQFYFVCPYKLIDPSEIDSEAGLIWTSKKATRLYIKKRAPRRDVEAPVDLLLYILIARTKITGANDMRIDNNSVAYWKRWLDDKKNNRVLGYAVSKKIREHVNETERENARLKRGIEEFEEIKKRMRELGLDPDVHVSVYSVERQLRALSDLFPQDTIKTIKEAHSAIGGILEKVEEKEDGD